MVAGGGASGLVFRRGPPPPWSTKLLPARYGGDRSDPSSSSSLWRATMWAPRRPSPPNRPRCHPPAPRPCAPVGLWLWPALPCLTDPWAPRPRDPTCLRTLTSTRAAHIPVATIAMAGGTTTWMSEWAGLSIDSLFILISFSAPPFSSSTRACESSYFFGPVYIFTRKPRKRKKNITSNILTHIRSNK